MSGFRGVQRRFNHIFTYRNSKFIDDYAHHPTEIKSVLESVKKVYTKEKIICIFQPHRISRLNKLKKEFESCFIKADTLILCPIFKAGESINLKFNYNQFVKNIIIKSKLNLIIVQNEIELLKFVRQSIFGDKIVIGMGAGSISSWIKMLSNKLK